MDWLKSELVFQKNRTLHTLLHCINSDTTRKSFSECLCLAREGSYYILQRLICVETNIKQSNLFIVLPSSSSSKHGALMIAFFKIVSLKRQRVHKIEWKCQSSTLHLLILTLSARASRVRTILRTSGCTERALSLRAARMQNTRNVTPVSRRGKCNACKSKTISWVGVVLCNLY